MRILGPAWMGGALCIDPEAASFKLQALTAGPGYDRMNLERRNIMDNETEDRSINPLIRIAAALEEILRLVKEDQERMKKLND